MNMRIYCISQVSLKEDTLQDTEVHKPWRHLNVWLEYSDSIIQTTIKFICI